MIGKLLQYNKLTLTIMVAGILFSCGTSYQKNKGSGKSNEGAKQQIVVFAAASVSDVLSEIVDSFEVKYHVKVKTNIASSGTLARQIEQGGIPDVYISASEKWANYVDSLGYFVKGHKQGIAKNELVLIAPMNINFNVSIIDSTFDFVSLLKSGRLSIGDPTHVPAGVYAKQSLEYYGWYKQLKGKMLPAKDVRSALMVVEMEEAPLGIVYKTDAKKSGKVKILYSFPEITHKPIVYVAGVCIDSKGANDFYTFLNSKGMRTIWAKYGFKN